MVKPLSLLKVSKSDPTESDWDCFELSVPFCNVFLPWHFNIAHLKATLDLQAAQEEAKVAAEEAQRAKQQATEVAWPQDSEKLSMDLLGNSMLLPCWVIYMRLYESIPRLYHMNQSYVIGLNMFKQEYDVISTHTIAYSIVGISYHFVL